VLHRHEHRAVELAHVVDGHHVGVGDAGDGLGLSHEAGPALAEQRRAQQLDGYATIELGIVGGIHHAHAARAQLVEHHVAADRCPPRHTRRLAARRHRLGLVAEPRGRIPQRLRLVSNDRGIFIHQPPRMPHAMGLRMTI
jgi:hypothetical protein